MFDHAWQALSCWAVLFLANAATLHPFFYHDRKTCGLPTSFGWAILLIGNTAPLTAVFYAVARSNRTDEGFWLAIGFGLIFLIRCASELGKIPAAIVGKNDG